MSNTLELLQDAALVLTQAGTVKDRLVSAYTNHLSYLDTSHVPDKFRDDFESMCEAMHRERPLPRENPVRASVRKMSSSEANGYAALVVKIYGAVARSGQSTLTRTPVLAPIVQLFAADG
jgi:hypothetical protein